MNAVLSQSSFAPPAHWRAPLLALLAVVAGLLLLYRETVVSMVGIWYRSETFAHAFLVLPISLWLVWRDRQRLQHLRPQPQPWMVLPMAVMAFVWLLGDMANVNAVTHFALTALLVLSVPAVLGRAVAWEMAFPLAFLFFMVPVGEFMLPVFMEWTADFTVAAVRMSGVPVYREGLQFVIPTGSWSVVEACSGVRYMIASFMVGSLFAYLNYSSLKRRLIFCAVSILVPLVANWVRAYFIVMLGHLSNNQLAVGVDHLVYGWVFFGVVIGLMFFIGARWSEPLPEATASSGLPEGGRTAQSVSAAALPATVVAIALVLVAPHGVGVALEPPANAKAPAPLVLPDLAGAMASDGPAPMQPISVNPASVAVRGYAFKGGVVTLHVAYYRHQTFTSKLVNSQNVLVPSETHAWQQVVRGPGSLSLPAGLLVWQASDLLQGNVSASASQRQRLDVRQLYWVDGRVTASDHRAVGYTLMGRLMGHGDDGARITIYTEGGTPNDTRERLDAFLKTHWPQIEAQLIAYRGQR